MTVPTKESLPRVALESMNHTHEEEIALVQLLAEALNESVINIDALNRAVDAWVAHTETHFETENQLMQEIGFPAYNVHRGEHEEVFAQIQQVVSRFRTDNELELLRQFVCELWPSWFDMHVRSMDMATAMFAKMQGR